MKKNRIEAIGADADWNGTNNEQKRKNGIVLFSFKVITHCVILCMNEGDGVMKRWYLQIR